jgi:hypothetical protein
MKQREHDWEFVFSPCAGQGNPAKGEAREKSCLTLLALSNAWAWAWAWACKRPGGLGAALSPPTTSGRPLWASRCTYGVSRLLIMSEYGAIQCVIVFECCQVAWWRSLHVGHGRGGDEKSPARLETCLPLERAW